MDYKEMIEKLRNICCVYADGGVIRASFCKDIATAIETLLAERDAAVSDIQRDCITCAHYESNNSKHIPCEFMEACRFAEHWEWRGPHCN